ncbi:MAG: Pyrophosphate--fructose 6-phosphate 1-phosphotransferase [Phycisphaerae bacterium]|nr:Pyrophosphate--fructose 6-phosphate 1-phosphotransferase [Phycisphaerae bacterium]
MSAGRLGILVGGGPAPGINAVIGAATIEAANQGFDILGFYDGFQWLCSREFDRAIHTVRLDIAKVTRIHFDGGSILRTSRYNLLNEELLKTSTVVANDPVKTQRVIDHLLDLGITHLVTIGGDDTAGSARFVADASQNKIRVAHVPKTIDNDLPLPHDIPTFGFNTARYWGSRITKNLMRDSQTTGRWYLITAMGRKAGWLAMGIGQSTGATLTLIPEEFGEKITLQRIADVIDGSILKRRAMGRPDGVALVAEGLAYRLGDREELKQLLGREVPMDANGHPRLAEFPLGDLLKHELEKRYKERGEKLTIITHELGYELRSADPTPSDVAYCRSLGHGSIRLLLDHSVPSGVMVTLVNGNLQPMSFDQMIDPDSNRMKVRMVDIRSDTYRVSRAYQIRLEKTDLEDPGMLRKLSAEAKMSPEEFLYKYRMAATRLTDPDIAELCA